MYALYDSAALHSHSSCYMTLDHFGAARHAVAVDAGNQEQLLHHTELPHESPTELYCEEVTLSTSSEQSISPTI